MEYDIAILGGGPGGYVAALRGARLGLKVVLVERDEVGGVCLNRGCIPTKALIRGAEVLSTVRRAKEFGIDLEIRGVEYARVVERAEGIVRRLRKGVEYLLRKAGVEVVKGVGRPISRDRIVVDGREIRARHMVIATGSRPMIPEGLEVDGRKVITSNEAIRLKELPQSMIILGGGAIGVEFAYLFSTFGVEVTILEAMGRILPHMDGEIVSVLSGALERMGVRIVTDARVVSVEREDKVRVKYISSKGEGSIDTDLLLIAVGRVPCSDGLEGIGIELERGFVKTNEDLETTLPGVYAIGDVSSPPLLAHKAMAEGISVAEMIGGGEVLRVQRDYIPYCIYTEPQVASIGITEEEALRKGMEVKTGTFPFRANGKALAMGEAEGMVKVVMAKKSKEIIGVHMVGPGVTELAGEVGVAKVLESTPLELSLFPHPHPTLSEALMEAAAAAIGKVIHL